MPFDFVHILYGFDLQIYNKTIALHVLQQKNPPHFRKAEFFTFQIVSPSENECTYYSDNHYYPENCLNTFEIFQILLLSFSQSHLYSMLCYIPFSPSVFACLLTIF